MQTALVTIPAVSSKRHIVAAGSLVLFLLIAGLAILKFDGPDIYIARLLNTVARRSPAFDTVLMILTRDMFSTAVLITLVCFVWFKHESLEARSTALVGMGTSVLGGVVSRATQYLVTTHPRPFHDATLNLTLPFGMEGADLNRWSSFPSDHATIASGLVTTIFLLDRRVGILAACFAAVSNLARVYLGIHFLDDIVGGAALGVFMVVAISGLSLRPFPLRVASLAFDRQKRPLLYALILYSCFSAGTLFSDARASVLEFWHAVHPKRTSIVQTSDRLSGPGSPHTNR